MAGPWFVDPQNGLTTNNGLSSDAPWKLIPGQTGATAQTGYGVVAGDVINVRNGTVTTLQIVPPANNLTYRGYGLATNVLTLTLPSGGGRKQNVRVVRTPGVHEGMWTVNANGASTFGMIDFGPRSGVTFEDVEVLAPLSDTPVFIGTASSTAIGPTIRRSRVAGSSATGIAIGMRQALIEDVLIEDIDDDGITFSAGSGNGWRAGYTDTIRRVCMKNVGRDTVSNLGDCIQTFADSGKFESGLVIQDLYIDKPSAVKQAAVFTDVLGGLVMERFLIESVPTGQAQILISGLGGNAIIRDGYIRNGCANNAAVRFSGTQGMETGTTLLVSGVIVDAATNAGFFTIGGSENACTIDGRIVITNCQIKGQNAQNFTFSGGVSMHAGALVTIGANASLLAANNIIECAGQPAVRLPVGGANDARWVVQNNTAAGMTWAIGATSYATPAAFEAAHSAATGNLAVLSATYQNAGDFSLRVPNGTTLSNLGTVNALALSGTYVSGVTLANGRLRPGYVPIGAYMAVLPRTART
jgi:hypothetical protein